MKKKQTIDRKEFDLVVEKMKQQSCNHSNLELRVQIVEENIKHMKRHIEELKVHIEDLKEEIIRERNTNSTGSY